MELTTSRLAASFFRDVMGLLEIEEFWVVGLNSTCQVLKAEMLFRGTVDSCFVHPRDIFRFAIKVNASSVLVGHNHPSGNNQPSPADEALTGRLKRAGTLLQIPLIDHIILCEQGYFSFSESRWAVAGLK